MPVEPAEKGLVLGSCPNSLLHPLAREKKPCWHSHNQTGRHSTEAMQTARWNPILSVFSFQGIGVYVGVGKEVIVDVAVSSLGRGVDVGVGVEVQVFVGIGVLDGTGVCVGVFVLVGKMMMTGVNVVVGVFNGVRVATFGT